MANQTDNGLDVRYGAGQVNVFNSHAILTAGEQDSAEDGNFNPVGLQGFDYDEGFGGANGTNSIATYGFGLIDDDATLTASLVWNIDIDGGNGPNFDGGAELFNLDLELFNVTTSEIFDFSYSSTENTENIWTSLAGGNEYELRVLVGEGQDAFDWDYGLAWQVTPVPVPASAWLFGSAILALLGLRRKKPLKSIEPYFSR